jgi:hypothetical protein
MVWAVAQAVRPGPSLSLSRPACAIHPHAGCAFTPVLPACVTL